MMPTFAKIGLDALLTPENCVFLLIDHQPFQLANVNSHDPTIVIHNVTALAKTAKVREDFFGWSLLGRPGWHPPRMIFANLRVLRGAL